MRFFLRMCWDFCAVRQLHKHNAFNCYWRFDTLQKVVDSKTALASLREEHEKLEFKALHWIYGNISKSKRTILCSTFFHCNMRNSSNLA